MITERELRRDAERVLGDDFNLAFEVAGRHMIEGKNVRIDMLCWPKQKLINAGFVGDMIGIEFKVIDQAKSHSGGLNRLFWQAITYSQSEFTHNGSTKRPAFVLVCINKSDLIDLRPYQTLMCFCEHANIGELIIGESGYAIKSYGRTAWATLGGRAYRSNVSVILTNRKIGSV